MSARRRDRAARHPWRTVVGTILAVVALVGSGGVSYALWADHGDVTLPEMARGVVSFVAAEQVDPTPQYAQATTTDAGTSVNVTVPGSVIAQALDGPVVWRFDVSGYAQGGGGLTYQVSYPDRGDGTDSVDSVWEGTVTKVYRGDSSGDCTVQDGAGDPPAAVDGVITSEDEVLQAPGGYDGAAKTHIWCVSMEWATRPAGEHVNVATATGTADDHSRVTSSDVLHAEILYPPALDPNGRYANTSQAQARALDGRLVSSRYTWSALLAPDPSLESDVTITLEPRVTRA
ncbi:MAG: hypothetical protein LBV06_03240 [Propionibacteriaceae bacterium]|jgi:hypothetical protein|nr:hypothetical protein [Propionibacteriaceae bacterium]